MRFWLSLLIKQGLCQKVQSRDHTRQKVRHSLFSTIREHAWRHHGVSTHVRIPTNKDKVRHTVMGDVILMSQSGDNVACTAWPYNDVIRRLQQRKRVSTLSYFERGATWQRRNKWKMGASSLKDKKRVRSFQYMYRYAEPPNFLRPNWFFFLIDDSPSAIWRCLSAQNRLPKKKNVGLQVQQEKTTT